jgi:hypothetical protein
VIKNATDPIQVTRMIPGIHRREKRIFRKIKKEARVIKGTTKRNTPGNTLPGMPGSRVHPAAIPVRKGSRILAIGNFLHGFIAGPG